MFQAIYCLRAGLAPRVMWPMLRPLANGYILRWNRRTKVRRGDRLRPEDEVVFAPQTSAARSPVLSDLLRRARLRPGSQYPNGLIFPGENPARVTALLRQYIEPHEPLILSAHGIRAGTDTVMKLLQVPDDVIRAMGWWSRARGADGYYASTTVDLMMRVTEVLHYVQLEPVEPGLCRLVQYHGPGGVPNWDILPRVPVVLPPVAAAHVAVEVAGESSSEEESRVAVLPPLRSLALPAPLQPARTRGTAHQPVRNRGGGSAGDSLVPQDMGGGGSRQSASLPPLSQQVAGDCPV